MGQTDETGPVARYPIGAVPRELIDDNKGDWPTLGEAAAGFAANVIATEYDRAAGAACRAAGLTLEQLTPERLREAMAARRLVRAIESDRNAQVHVHRPNGRSLWLTLGQWDVFDTATRGIIESNSDLTAALDALEAPDA